MEKEHWLPIVDSRNWSWDIWLWTRCRALGAFRKK